MESTSGASLLRSFSPAALQQWREFIEQYQHGDFPRGAPPPIPSVVVDALAAPLATSSTPPSPSYLKNALGRPETAEQLLEFYCLNHYLPSPVSSDEARRKAIIKRYGLDDVGRLASIDEVASLGRMFFKDTTVIVTAVLEEVVLLLGSSAPEGTGIDWGAALRDLDQSLSLCRHNMLGTRDDVFLIIDSRTDWRVHDNPVFSQKGGPLSFYASARIRLPLSGSTGPPDATNTLPIGNVCLLGAEPREEGSFTDEHKEVLKNLSKRISRELQLGHEERRRARGRQQADYISSLLQHSQPNRQRRNSNKKSPGMSAVVRDQLVSSGLPSEMFAGVAEQVTKYTDASAAMILDFRSLVKSIADVDNAASKRRDDPRRPALRRTASGQSTVQSTPTSCSSSSTVFLRPVTVLGQSGHESGAQTTLARPQSLDLLATALRQWQRDPSRDYIIGDALTSLLPMADKSHLAIPILDHLDHVALVVLVTSDLGLFDIEPADRTFMENIGNVALSRLIKDQVSEADHAKLAFVSQVSHQLRTPVHGLVGQLALIRECSSPAQLEPIDSYLKVADVCIESLRETLDATLDFAKLSDLTLATNEPAEAHETVDLAAMLHDTVVSAYARQMRLTSAAGDDEGDMDCAAIDVVLDLAGREEGWLASVQVSNWRRIVSAIVSNAFTFTHQGSVRVCLREGETSASSGPNVVFEVTDTGIGMSSYFLQGGLLFQPFRQADSFSPGTGLGMAIVQELVSRMHGRVNVTSQLGEGTKVEVVLPCKLIASSPAPPLVKTLAGELDDLKRVLSSPLPLRAPSFGDIPAALSTLNETASSRSSVSSAATEETIITPASTSPLLPVRSLAPPTQGPFKRPLSVFAAEDNPIARRVLSALLQQKGYDFRAVVDGQRAVDAFKEGFRPDVTLMDVQMPHKDGIAASFEIRDIEKEMGWPRHRIIALTGLSNPEDVSKALDNGAGEAPIDSWIVKGGNSLRVLSEELELMQAALGRVECT